MRVCIIGNSHLAAVKLAVEQGALKGTKTEIVFFGAPGQRFKKLRFKNGVVCGPDSLERMLLQVSGGQYSKIAPKDFAAIVIYGGSLFLHRLVGNIYQTVEKNGVYLSDQCLSTGIERWLAQKPIFRLAKEIRATGKTRVILAPRPVPAVSAAPDRNIVDRNQVTPWIWDNLAPEFRQKIWAYCKKITEREGIELLLQPEDTFDSNQYTKVEFTANSTRLLGRGRTHEHSDVTHMNAEYGAYFLRHLLSQLAS